MAALEKELRVARRSLSGAGPTAAPSTSAASIEGPVVRLPTPTDPAAPPLSSRLASCTITLRASGSDIAGHGVYPRVEDRPPPSKFQCVSHEDSLEFEVEEDLESGEPSQEGHGLPSHDAESGHLMDVSAHDDCVGRWARAGRRSWWTMVPLRSSRLQRVPLHTMKCKRRSMSSTKRALAAMRYSF